jgi:hypothetical protein
MFKEQRQMKFVAETMIDYTPIFTKKLIVSKNPWNLKEFLV